MNIYKYSLRKYAGTGSKLTCPQCNRHKCFTPYINTDTEEIIDETVGRCDHVNSCGYHKTPREFFGYKQINGFTGYKNRFTDDKNRFTDDRNNFVKEFNVIEKEWIKTCDYFRSEPHNLFMYLDNRLNGSDVKINGKIIDSLDLKAMFKRMCVTSGINHETVYYQIDLQGNVRTAKIIPYNINTGHRLKNTDCTPANRYTIYVNWLHSVYMKQTGLKDFHLQQVPFGLSELIKVKDKIKPVNIYEAEKTACVMDLFYHEQAFHLSVGGVQNIKSDILLPVKQLGITKINLFPDKGCYQDWRNKAIKVSNELQLEVAVNNQLENTQLNDGDDLVDLLGL